MILLCRSWLTPAVLSIAQAAYEARDPTTGHLDPVRLAIFADALEEAGCAGEKCEECQGDGWIFDIPPVFAIRLPLDKRKACSDCNGTGRIAHPLLAHLRSSGPHVCGCHVLDLCLGLS